MPTSTELRVAAIYAAVLEIERVQFDDDLYRLGCDSLQAVRIALEIERSFGIGLPLEMLETTGQVVEVAAWIDTEMGASCRRCPS